MIINNDELEIFSRQLILNEFNENSFDKLQKKKVSIVGMGGIGCPLAQYLISSGIKHLNLFDKDIVKKNNLNRQTLFNIKDLNKSKIIVAKKKLLNINPHAKINSYNQMITKSNIEMLNNSSIIIDASDNWITMKLVNEYASNNNIPLISCSVLGFNIQLILFQNIKKKHLCLECIFPNKEEPKLARCDTVGVLGTSVGIAGLLSAQKTINFLMKFGENKELLTLIDCKTLSINQIKVKKKNNCRLLKIKS